MDDHSDETRAAILSLARLLNRAMLNGFEEEQVADLLKLLILERADAERRKG